eukprot:CAMPEP_0171267990 /NCGR_PEP_ID=MMETSP0790-20130122/59439_1 /TAXON_ID=2925 /ORGANISM="Alexandrium catenella, Strain OF101" /LENGTH=77 /DNA_ID=CAMNT_0011736735 /DNA_START=66 /DNA_END=295 /DNA_ORIENTATION=-
MISEFAPWAQAEVVRPPDRGACRAEGGAHHLSRGKRAAAFRGNRAHHQRHWERVLQVLRGSGVAEECHYEAPPLVST